MNDFLYQALLLYEKVYTLPLFRVGLIAIAFLFFLFSIGLVRQHYFHLTMRGANFGFLAGILFVLILEAVGVFILIYGPQGLEIVAGRHNQNEIAQMTREGVGRLGIVLGQATQKGDRPTATNLLEQIPKLSRQEEDKIRAVLCR